MSKFRTPYNFTVETNFATMNREKSLTQQSDARDTDINVIAPMFLKGLQVPGTAQQPLFGDFRNAPTFIEANQMILAAEDAFLALPAKIRERFQNDTGKLIEFLQDTENKDEAIKLGLLERPKPDITPTPATTPAPTTTTTPNVNQSENKGGTS